MRIKKNYTQCCKDFFEAFASLFMLMSVYIACVAMIMIPILFVVGSIIFTVFYIVKMVFFI